MRGRSSHLRRCPLQVHRHIRIEHCRCGGNCRTSTRGNEFANIGGRRDATARNHLQNLYAKHKINFVPAHPDVAVEPSLAEVLKGAKIFPIDDAYAGANRKRIVERWINEVLNLKE